MTRKFDQGKAVPVTVIEAMPNVVVGLKSQAKDGYNSVVIGAGTKKESKINKPLKGQLIASKSTPCIIKESCFDNVADVKPGDKVDVSQFEVGDKIKVSAVTKGKGFSGVIKRHSFHRGPETHGSDHHRAPGSIGGGYPQRVILGKKMPGHLGAKSATQKNIEVLEVMKEDNLLLLKGSIPGANKSWVIIKS